jgi:uncharacterized protein
MSLLISLGPIAGAGAGFLGGLIGVGGGTLTTVVTTLVGMPMHKSIGRAAAAGLVVSIPATPIAALTSMSADAGSVGSINLSMRACIATAQAAAAWAGAQFTQRIAGEHLSRVFAVTLAATGLLMLHSSFGWS